MLSKIKTKLVHILLFGTVALFLATGIHSASAATLPLPLPIETFVSGGTTIHVEVALANGTGQHPTVLLLYGENGEVGLFPWNFPSIAVWFASEGYNCFIVHYLDKGPALPSVTIFTEYLQVINDATTWAQGQPGVDPAKLAILGDSLGAGLGISESSRDPRIKVLAAWSGAEATWYEQAVRNTITYMPPTILIHGANDTVSPVANAYALQTLLNGLQIPEVLDVYPSEGHVFNMPDQQESLQQTLAFFQQYI
jgi:dipeptidyl aminopeptidase/acylaminoacyl peptidase